MRPPGERAGWSVLPLHLPSVREAVEAELGRVDCRPMPPPLPVEGSASRSPSLAKRKDEVEGRNESRE